MCATYQRLAKNCATYQQFVKNCATYQRFVENCATYERLVKKLLAKEFSVIFQENKSVFSQHKIPIMAQSFRKTTFMLSFN